VTEEVRDDPDRSRYELLVDGRVAGFAAYRRRGDVLEFTHTEVDEEFEGQGLGSTLIRGALDDARRDGFAVLPRCPFVRAFIEKHEEYADLVPAEQRADFGLSA
jgi:predicted GNAT family acetyltransferase